MAIETAADRAAMLDAWGHVVVFGGVTIPGIFERKYVTVVDSESYEPTVECRTADVSTANHGDAITVNGVAYSIDGIQPSDDGAMTTLLLKVT